MENVFIACFGTIKDPRKDRTKKHDFNAILALAILASLQGAQTCKDIWITSVGHYEWLKTKFNLVNGIPCQDTFRRVFNVLNNNAFQDASLLFLKKIVAILNDNGMDASLDGDNDPQIACDGKILRGSICSWPVIR